MLVLCVSCGQCIVDQVNEKAWRARCPAPVTCCLSCMTLEQEGAWLDVAPAMLGEVELLLCYSSVPRVQQTGSRWKMSGQPSAFTHKGVSSPTQKIFINSNLPIRNACHNGSSRISQESQETQ